MDSETITVLRQCPLFEGVAEGDIPALLGCLGAKSRAYGKGQEIFAPGAAIVQVGIVLAGSVRVEQDDYWGNRAILAQLGPGELFGEAFSCAEVPHLPVAVVAAEPARALFVDYRKIAGTCASACAFHARLIRNMLYILAQKNVALTQKMEALAQRTTRDKLLAYLSNQAKRAGRNQFDIPFNRQELADYLAVDRSAMSSELSKMRREGLLRAERNHFQLL